MKVAELLESLKGKEDFDVLIEYSSEEGYVNAIEVLINAKKKKIVLREEND
jgi:hypothetical protein